MAEQEIKTAEKVEEVKEAKKAEKEVAAPKKEAAKAPAKEKVEEKAAEGKTTEKKEKAPAEKKAAAETKETTEKSDSEDKPAVKVKRRKGKKYVVEGKCYLQITFNNTVITITDKLGNTVSWSSAGACGFKGSRKGTPFAAQMAAEKAGNKAREFGMKSIDLYLNGAGPGRESAVRTLNNLGFEITGLFDVTPLPHNGCRPRKRRRV